MLVQTAQRQTYVGRARRRSAVACSATLNTFHYEGRMLVQTAQRRPLRVEQDDGQPSPARPPSCWSWGRAALSHLPRLRRFPFSATFEGKGSEEKKKGKCNPLAAGCRLRHLDATTKRQLRTRLLKVPNCQQRSWKAAILSTATP
jgi:hypothetical protein